MQTLAFLVLVSFCSVGRAAAQVEPNKFLTLDDSEGPGPGLDAGWKFSFVDVPPNLSKGRATTQVAVFSKHKDLRSVFTKKRSQRLDKSGNTKVYEFVFRDVNPSRPPSQSASFGESSCPLEEASFVAALDEIEALEGATDKGKQVADVVDTDGGDLGSRFERFEEGGAVPAKKTGKSAEKKKGQRKSTDCKCMLARKIVKKKIPKRLRKRHGGKKCEYEEIVIVQCPDNCNKPLSTFVAQDFKARGKCL